MLPITVCIIGKNEEENIGHCLKPLLPHFSEIIYVDTGSTDRTVDCALKYVSVVHHFRWTDNFSDARNYSIGLASNEWILTVDCDEFLTEINPDSIYHFIQSHPTGVGRLKRINNYQLQGQNYAISEYLNRLFSKKYYHYSGIIHEQLTPLTHSTMTTQKLPLKLLHSGYACSPLQMKQKAIRNIRLLQNSLKFYPDDPYVFFQLGQSFFVISEYEKAAHYFQEGLSLDTDPEEDYVQFMVESYGYCLLYLKEYQRALSFLSIYDTFGQKADFVFLMGLIFMNNACFQEAIQEFQKATTLKKYSVEGVTGFLAYYNIGVIYECLGDLTKAKDNYKKCGSYQAAQNRLAALEGGKDNS